MADVMVMVVKLTHGIVGEIYGPYTSAAGTKLAAELDAAQGRVDPDYKERTKYSTWALSQAPSVDRIERPYRCLNDACPATAISREEADAHFPIYRERNEPVGVKVHG